MPHGERFNTLTHLAGLGLVLLAGGWLLARAVRVSDASTLAGLAVFSAAAAAVYAASVVFHGSRDAQRRRWQRLDHCAIYLLIAGSCTAFALAAPTHAWRIGLLAVVWAFALWAIRGEWRADAQAAPVLLRYVTLGWAGVAVAVPAAASLGTPVLAWLLGGGVVYSVGTVFYRNRGGWRHAHGTWHLFVLGGTSCHFAALACAIG